MKYPIAETFYSIIGEGEWTGHAAFFIRLAGCNLNCEFCDTNYRHKDTMTEEDLFFFAKKHPARKVVITGGEPCIHILRPLTGIFRKEFKIHLETNGTIVPDNLDMDWIAVSPKPGLEIKPFILGYASEIKFLCGKQLPNWKEYMEDLLPRVGTEYKWLLPIANGLELDMENVKMAVQYCLENPGVKFCLQVHKVVGVK